MSADREALISLVAGAGVWIDRAGEVADAILESEEFIIIPKPCITTGPKHMTEAEATAMYLADVASRIRQARYWGSGVTRLVSTLCDDVAAAVARQEVSS